MGPDRMGLGHETGQNRTGTWDWTEWDMGPDIMVLGQGRMGLGHWTDQNDRPEGLGRETGHTGTGTECVYTLYSAGIGTFNEKLTWDWTEWDWDMRLDRTGLDRMEHGTRHNGTGTGQNGTGTLD